MSEREPGEQLAYPERPNSEVTPGTLCEDPDRFRYPEEIPYCNRDVRSKTKWEIIDYYDQELGFKIRILGRQNFKVDHLIPLCMGGSNEVTNLWPQYRAIYRLTDPLEPMLCGRVASGEMKQAEAVEIILKAKQDPYSAPDVYCELTGENCDYD